MKKCLVLVLVLFLSVVVLQLSAQPVEIDYVTVDQLHEYYKETPHRYRLTVITFGSESVVWDIDCGYFTKGDSGNVVEWQYDTPGECVNAKVEIVATNSSGAGQKIVQSVFEPEDLVVTEIAPVAENKEENKREVSPTEEREEIYSPELASYPPNQETMLACSYDENYDKTRYSGLIDLGTCLSVPKFRFEGSSFVQTDFREEDLRACENKTVGDYCCPLLYMSGDYGGSYYCKQGSEPLEVDVERKGLVCHYTIYKMKKCSPLNEELCEYDFQKEKLLKIVLYEGEFGLFSGRPYIFSYIFCGFEAKRFYEREILPKYRPAGGAVRG